MSIVFEEMSGEIVPERRREAGTAQEQPKAEAPDPAEKLRCALALMQERAARLGAD